MSVSTASTVGSSYQPYQCLICQSRFTRHENLKRHAALHSRPQGQASLSCDLCQATFSRQDLRSRHMKRKHPDHCAKRAAGVERGNQSASGPRRGAKKPRREKMVSLSPPESQYVWNHGNDDVTEYEGNWHSEGRQGQHEPEHDHDYLGVDINFSTSAPGTDVDNSHIVTGLLTEQPSMNDLMSINHVVGDADIDQNGLLLRGSMPALPCYPGTKTRLVEGVRAASLSTNMTSLNIWALYHYYAPPQLFAAFGTLMGCAVLFMATISFYRWLVLRENKRLDSGEPSEIAKVVKGGVTDEWYSWAGDMRCTAQERP